MWAWLSILNLQSIYGWSDTSVNALLNILKSALLLETNQMPKSRDVAKGTLSDVDMDYECIHACPNDYILYRGDYATMESCPKCQASCYCWDHNDTTILAKILRHFPIISHISHMFMYLEIAKLMTWHVTSRSTDDIMRIPTDSNLATHWREMARVQEGGTPSTIRSCYG